MGAARVSDETSIALRLAREVSRQLDINAKLGEALLKELGEVVEHGRDIVMFGPEGPHVVGKTHVPDRDWARCYGHYRGTNKDLLTEQREGIKLRHQLQQTGKALTEEQYAAEMLDLGKEALRTLTREEVQQVLAERGITVAEVEERDE